MERRRRLLAVTCAAALQAAACASGLPSATARASRVIDRGGELADAEPERAAVIVTADRVIVWGSAELPDDSRLSMAYAGVDAIARSELLKAVRVRLRAVLTDAQSTDDRRRALVLETIEAVDGTLAHAGPLPHGWARVRRGRDVVLRVWARLDVPRTSIESSLRGRTSPWLDGLALSDDDDADLDAPADAAAARGREEP